MTAVQQAVKNRRSRRIVTEQFTGWRHKVAKTTGLMWAMTTPIRRPISKRWNTGRIFRNGSGVPKTAGYSARTFSAGTIPSIIIPESDFSHRKMSITDGLNKLSKNVRQFWMMLLQNIQSGSRERCQNQWPYQGQPGSINRYQEIVINYDTKFFMEVSHCHWQVPYWWHLCPPLQFVIVGYYFIDIECPLSYILTVKSNADQLSI